MTASAAYWIAGILAIATGLVHGVLGERRVLARIDYPNIVLATLSRGIWWVSVAAWMMAGLLFILLAGQQGNPLEFWIVVSQAVVLGVGIFFNFVATRGRHPGWMLLAASLAFAFYGLSR